MAICALRGSDRRRDAHGERCTIVSFSRDRIFLDCVRA
jgi:hypothetical protein